MAHTRTTDQDARIVTQCARGRYIRMTWQKPLAYAVNRTANPVADVIDGETQYVGIGIAPCDGKVVRATVQAKTFPITSGAATIRLYKNGAVALTSSLSIDEVTVNTALDFTLTEANVNLSEGDYIYATLALTATTGTNSEALVVQVEFMPTDKSYAGS